MGREKGRKCAIRWGELRGLLGFGRGELHVRRTSEAGCEHAVCMCARVHVCAGLCSRAGQGSLCGLLGREGEF